MVLELRSCLQGKYHFTDIDEAAKRRHDSEEYFEGVTHELIALKGLILWIGIRKMRDPARHRWSPDS